MTTVHKKRFAVMESASKFDRWIVREIVGELPDHYRTANPYRPQNDNVSRRKEGAGLVAEFSDLFEAEKACDMLNSTAKDARAVADAAIAAAKAKARRRADFAHGGE